MLTSSSSIRPGPNRSITSTILRNIDRSIGREGIPIKSVHLSYFASLRESRGLEQETLLTDVLTAGHLYAELKERHAFTLPEEALRVAVNGTFVTWQTPLNDQDRVAFIPPVSGG